VKILKALLYLDLIRLKSFEFVPKIKVVFEFCIKKKE
jgi:hypothetical protein